jgi:hypothetical protein
VLTYARSSPSNHNLSLTFKMEGCLVPNPHWDLSASLESTNLKVLLMTYLLLALSNVASFIYAIGQDERIEAGPYWTWERHGTILRALE